MALKRKSASQLIKPITEDDALDITHQVSEPSGIPPARAPAPEHEILPEAPAATDAPAEPVAPGSVNLAIPARRLPNDKKAVMNVRCQVAVTELIKAAADLHRLTVSSYMQLSAAFLLLQPKEIKNEAWKLLMDVERAGAVSGNSAPKGIRYSKRFAAEIIDPLSAHALFANNRSQALKAAAVYVSKLPDEAAEALMIEMRTFDAENDFGLTENARASS